MSDSVHKLKVLTKGEKNQVKEQLEYAIEQEYDAVLIIGIKDNRYKFRRSGIHDMAETVGLLEMMKHDLIDMAK